MTIKPAPIIVINSPLVGVSVRPTFLTIRIGSARRFYPRSWT